MASNPKLSPILEVAKNILSASKAGMHVNDIAAAAVSANQNLGLSQEDFARKLSSALASNIKIKTSLFSKPLNKDRAPRKGIYRLKKRASGTTAVKPPTAPTIDTMYSGKAGEYAVASELLFWGFNISLMAVDKGIDLVAEKAGKFHHVQVKTAMTEGGKAFGFSVTQKAFESCQALQPWYVFAMRQGSHTDYAVIPSSLLLHLRTTGIIGGKDLSIQISRDDKKQQYKLNGSHDINMYINNFGLIQ